MAPIRIGIQTGIDGVEFTGCAMRAIAYHLGEDLVPVIGLDDLKANKAAGGRNKDLDDLENLPSRRPRCGLRRRPSACQDV